MTDEDREIIKTHRPLIDPCRVWYVQSAHEAEAARAKIENRQYYPMYYRLEDRSHVQVTYVVSVKWLVLHPEDVCTVHDAIDLGYGTYCCRGED